MRRQQYKKGCGHTHTQVIEGFSNNEMLNEDNDGKPSNENGAWGQRPHFKMTGVMSSENFKYQNA
jgi:hypothetical protein